MIQKLKIVCLILVLLFIPVSVYGKISIDHLNYQDFYEAYYSTYSNEEIYNNYPYLNDIIIKDVTNYEDLVNNSPYVLIVTVNNIEIYGEGIINQCTIDKVIKGNDLKANNQINIYDHAFVYSQYAITYFEGAMPLNINDQYIVFIDQSINPNIKNSYIFKSIKYGSFKVSNLNHYHLLDNETLTINQILNYDYVSQESVDLVKYDQLYHEIKQNLF